MIGRLVPGRERRSVLILKPVNRTSKQSKKSSSSRGPAANQKSSRSEKRTGSKSGNSSKLSSSKAVESSAPERTRPKPPPKKKEKDERLHYIISPCLGQPHSQEWASSSRGGESIWTVAARVGRNEEYADALPDAFPSMHLRFTTPMLPIPSGRP